MLKHLLGLSRRAGIVLKLQFLNWRISNLPLKHRAGFAATSVLAPILHRISHCGSKFYSDNGAALLLLPEYAQLCTEVMRTVGSDGGPDFRLLDIGANVGQFGATMRRLFDVSVDSVEPNPECWPFLIKNGASVGPWKLHRRAISGVDEVKTLWYVPHRSAQGSFSVSNATADLLGNPQAEQVQVSTGPFVVDASSDTRIFDLVKIDVEGFELDVVRGLRGVEFRYLLIEIDESRENGFSVRDLEVTVASELARSIKPLHCDRPDWTQGPRNMLFEVSGQG